MTVFLFPNRYPDLQLISKINQILKAKHDYLSEIMEDSHDLVRGADKGAHAVCLCNAVDPLEPTLQPTLQL